MVNSFGSFSLPSQTFNPLNPSTTNQNYPASHPIQGVAQKSLSASAAAAAAAGGTFPSNHQWTPYPASSTTNTTAAVGTATLFGTANKGLPADVNKKFESFLTELNTQHPGKVSFAQNFILKKNPQTILKLQEHLWNWADQPANTNAQSNIRLLIGKMGPPAPQPPQLQPQQMSYPQHYQYQQQMPQQQQHYQYQQQQQHYQYQQQMPQQQQQSFQQQQPFQQQQQSAGPVTPPTTRDPRNPYPGLGQPKVKEPKDAFPSPYDNPS